MYFVFALQENYVSLWSIGDLGNVDSDGGFEGDHQLLCDIRHHGDVMDLQVSLCNSQKLTLKKKQKEKTESNTFRNIKDLKVCLVSPLVQQKRSSLKVMYDWPASYRHLLAESGQD